MRGPISLQYDSYLAAMSHEDIAAELGISKQAVMATERRAMKKLRRVFVALGIGPGFANHVEPVNRKAW